MRRLVAIAVSAGILAAIYWQIDVASLGLALARSEPMLLGLGLAMVVPLTLLTGWRLSMLAGPRTALPLGEATRLTLAASVLNMVLPSKLGDIAKAWAISRRGYAAGPVALSLVVLEKGWDTLSLLAWCVLGLALYPQRGPMLIGLEIAVLVGTIVGALALGWSGAAPLIVHASRRLLPDRIAGRLDPLAAAWVSTVRWFWQDRARAIRQIVLSVFLWFLHLLQIWLFALALRSGTPFLANLALAPLAIFAGLLPFTFAGVGTRDAALILLYQPYLTAPAAGALGVLCTLRYLLPALGGLPFLATYTDLVRRARRAGPAGS